MIDLYLNSGQKFDGYRLKKHCDKSRIAISFKL